MNFDGTYTYDGETTEDLTGEITSDDYPDKSVAISNCPAKELICGSKEVVLNDK